MEGWEFVEITAADLNGQTWDGSPFNDYPDWLVDALNSKQISVYPGDRDYALWKIRYSPNIYDEYVIGGPGDYIVKSPKGMIFLFSEEVYNTLVKGKN